jgi:predicted glycosyltransferase
MTDKKIWIDLDNSPHVPFFIPIKNELEKRGCEILLTARDTYQVCDLIKFHNLPCEVIGGNYGKNKILKVIGNCSRAAQLLPVAMKNKPDLALSHGSRAQVLVCAALGIPTIMMHDYEFTTKTGFLEPTWTLMPDVIPTNVMSKKVDRVLKYPGLKEDVYVPSFHPDRSLFKTLGISESDILVTLRPPATEAHYHNPESEKLFAATVELLSGKPHVRTVTLPRSAKQGAELRQAWSKLIQDGRIIIPDSPVDGLNLIWFSDLVISGGGTMNREAAALGVPVYSIFRGKIGAVDRYLAEHGRMVLLESVDDVRTKINLTPREKKLASGVGRTDTLAHIVQTIIAIGESKCPPMQAPKN